MTFAVAWIWKMSAVLCGAFLLECLLRRASAARRELLWSLTFAVLILLPPLSLMLPGWDAPAGTPLYAVAVTAGAAGAANTVQWAPWVWLGGFLLALGRLGAAHVRAALLVRRSRPVEGGSGVRLRESPPGTMPLTWGLLRPVVILPADASGWDPDVRRSVMAHELAHVRRGDLPKQLLEQLACAFYWFHPLVWLAAARASDARERACDDEVLAQGFAAADYASHLIEVARRVRPLSSVAATTFCARLEGRIMSILDSRRNRRAAGHAVSAAAAALAGLLLVSISGFRLAAEEVHKIGSGVSAPRLVHKVEPKYTKQARDAGIEGAVVLLIEISSRGIPENIQVKLSLDPGLDENAVEAVGQWVFVPGEKDGQPVRVAATIEVNFRLD